MALMPSTCSLRQLPSRKSQRWASPFSPAFPCRSSRDWFTVFSSSRAASRASRGVPHSMVVGLATSWKTTLPPLLVRRLLEEGSKAGVGCVIPVKVGVHGHVDVAGVELHVNLLVDQSLALLLEVLSDTGSHFKMLNVWSCVRMF